MINDNLVLFTEQFPITNLETFLIEEIEYLQKQYKTIYFIPLGCPTLEVFQKTEKTDFVKLELKQIPRIRTLIKKEFKTILQILKTEKKESGNFKRYLLKPVRTYKELVYAIKTAYYLNTVLPQNVTLYSYWYGHWSISIAIYKFLFSSKSNWITKMHGYDLDPKQISDGFYPYRAWNNQFLNKAIPISNYGKELFLQSNPSFKNKIQTHYLGINNKKLALIPKNENYTIVSCSKVINLKRLHVIIELLSCLNRKIVWIHFGDGELMNTILLKAKSLPDNIAYEFKGKLSNEEIMNYYKNNEVDLFINTSLLEGLPYSMIEAASFGIPLAGFNVCGIPEILSKKMGVLLDTALTIEENADKIKSFLIAKLSREIEYRKQIQMEINSKFNAQVNYTNFIEQALAAKK